MCFRKNVCVCVCVSVCLSDRCRSQSLNQSTDLVQIRYLGFSCKYLEPFFSFPSTPKIKGSSHEKIFLKIFIFSKMAPTILIKFCGFIVHVKPNNMALSAFPGKILETRKISFKIDIQGPLANISSLFLVFPLPLKLRVVHIRKKLKTLIFSKIAPTILIKFC